MAVNVSLDEQIEAVESLIERYRFARNSESGDRTIYLTLKVVASDLRARRAHAPGRARDRLQRAISNAKDLKGDEGYRMRDLRSIAETVISEWPVILQSLEQLEQREKTNG